ncbi:MAG: aldo/keto reductase [Spirochaetaceae bacterium]
MIERKTFGNTFHNSSRVIFGGASLSSGDEEQAARALSHLRFFGVNHIDTSVSYGEADRCIGEWLEEGREDFFLGGKIDARTYKDAREELDVSLKNLGTDHFDLLQMHELVRQEDVDAFLNGDGAAGVLMEAQKKGLARFIGVTGHGYEAPRLLKQCVEKLPLDSVLLPWNYTLSTYGEYNDSFQDLRELCRSRGIAVQTIKSIARGPWGTLPQTRSTWYRPLEEKKDIARAVHWVLGHEELFLCSVGDVDLLPKVLGGADSFTSAPSREEMEEMRVRLEMTMPEQHQWPRLG